MSAVQLQNAAELRRAGRLAEAAEIYSQVLTADPKNFEALHTLGLLRYQAGDLQAAERLIAEATRANPLAADAFYNHGSLLLRLQRADEALACFGQALALRPDYIEAFGNRSGALLALGRFADALADLDRLVALKPGLPEAWGNRGAALAKMNRLAEAKESYRRALALRPNHPGTWRNRGLVAMALKDYAGALADAEQALRLDASSAEFWELKAHSLAALDRRKEAILSYDRALALKPDAVDALFNRANMLTGVRRLEDAARDLASVVRLRPDYAYARGNLAFCKLCMCDWQDVEDRRADVIAALRRGEPASPPFQALGLSAGNAEALTAAVAAMRLNPPSPEPLWRGERYDHGKIRVAYLSANFNDHAVARLMAGVFERHDRTRFETIAFSFGAAKEGAMRTRLRRAFDRFIDAGEMDARTIAESMRQMEIDIAIDLMGLTEGCRPDILSHRPAPVQVNYLGYPGTMAADYIDYILADTVVIPSGERPYYREKLVHLPHSYLPADSSRAIAARIPSRSEAGLPNRGIVFCCFNNPYKFNASMFDVWMRLLHAVEGSVLWLSLIDTVAVANLKREAEVRGVDPARLVFALYAERDEDHLARLKLADLFLDTLPYNAHATASDALWAGVPVITVSGPTFPGRVAASLLRAIGMPEMIAPSLADYERIALELARDSAALSAVKDKLSHHRTTQPLFDTAGFTRDLESAFSTMWQRTQAGLLPEAFSVGAQP